MKIHRHAGVGRYPVIYTWIPDQVRNDVQHFHVSLCPKRAWALVKEAGSWTLLEYQSIYRSYFRCLLSKP